MNAISFYDNRQNISKREVPRDVQNSKIWKQESLKETGLNIRTYASSKVRQNQVSGGVSVFCWHNATVANVLWKPHAKLGKKMSNGNKKKRKTSSSG